VNDTDTFVTSDAELVRRLEERNGRLQEALQTANQEIDSLTYSIVHDLRRPLLHIDGFAQLLRTSTGAVLDRENRDYLERIIGATRTMSDQLGSLLEYSRVNSVALVVTDVDLEELLGECGPRRRWVAARRSSLPFPGRARIWVPVADYLVANAFISR
jgi:signal transduction histidine kinase